MVSFSFFFPLICCCLLRSSPWVVCCTVWWCWRGRTIWCFRGGTVSPWLSRIQWLFQSLAGESLSEWPVQLTQVMNGLLFTCKAAYSTIWGQGVKLSVFCSGVPVFLSYSESLQMLLSSIMVSNPQERPNISWVLDQVQDLLSQSPNTQSNMVWSCTVWICKDLCLHYCSVKCSVMTSLYEWQRFHNIFLSQVCKSFYLWQIRQTATRCQWCRALAAGVITTDIWWRFVETVTGKKLNTCLKKKKNKTI